MKIIATLVSNPRTAYKILREIPRDSVILFPESVDLSHNKVNKYSEDRQLFVIYNQDTVKNGKNYITMKGVDNGEYQWIVRKFNLWYSDKIDGFATPSKPEPFVYIRNRKAGVFICYDAVKIFQMRELLEQEKIELLLIGANWQYNFELIQKIIDFGMKYIPTLRGVVFSNTRNLAIVKTRKETMKIKSAGWVDVDIDDNLR